MKLKPWFLATRPQFLTLSVVLAFLGSTIAWYDGYFQIGHALLAGLGLLLAHISCQAFNDYIDYNSGVDLVTPKTPFSGGSGVLPAALLTPRQVLWMGISSFLLIIPIGVYFMIAKGWLLLPLLLVAAVCIVFYTPVILKTRWPEWAAGLGLGTLPILGVYFVQIGAYTWSIAVASIPSGILVHNLLLLNEFPDTEADKTANRKTLPITMGKTGAGVVYSVLTALVYLWIIGWVVAGLMPIFCLIALLTIPLAIKAIQGALKPQGMDQLMSTMATNVMVVLLTQLFLGIGYVLATVF